MECFEDNVKGSICSWTEIVTDYLFGFAVMLSRCVRTVFVQGSLFHPPLGLLVNDRRTRVCMGNLYNLQRSIEEEISRILAVLHILTPSLINITISLLIPSSMHCNYILLFSMTVFVLVALPAVALCSVFNECASAIFASIFTIT